jgi:hypothetical protein
MRRVVAGQLSFDAAPKAGKRAVDTASLKLSGAFPGRALVDAEGRWPQLGHGEEVVVQVIELGSGEVIAEGLGRAKVGFEDTTTEGETFTSRVHTVKMGDGDIPPERGVARAAQSLVDHLDANGLTMTVEAGGKSATIGGRAKRRAKVTA